MSDPTPYRPGLPLPPLAQARENTLYHATRRDGTLTTMTREGSLWRWRSLYGPEYGEGGELALKGWLDS